MRSKPRLNRRREDFRAAGVFRQDWRAWLTATKYDYLANSFRAAHFVATLARAWAFR